MNLNARFEAFIPPEPPGLTIVTDKDGIVWQRFGDFWRSPAGLMTNRVWSSLLLIRGPVYPLKWDIPSDVGTEGE